MPDVSFVFRMHCDGSVAYGLWTYHWKHIPSESVVSSALCRRTAHQLTCSQLTDRQRAQVKGKSTLQSEGASYKVRVSLQVSTAAAVTEPVVNTCHYQFPQAVFAVHLCVHPLCPVLFKISGTETGVSETCGLSNRAYPRYITIGLRQGYGRHVLIDGAASE